MPTPDHNQLPEWKKELDRPRMKSLADLFPVPKPVIGMVHLWPLPGAPGYTGYGMQKIIDHALRDAEALVQGGVNGLAVENMWDLPYYVGNDVKPEAMTAHAVAAAEIVKNFPIPVGINVIHNGGTVCLSIALAASARWIRVCILTGARVWDTGEFDHGCAAELMRKRKELHAEGIHIFADVDKKHSVPFPGIDLRTHIEWTEFYGADALIVSGRFTRKRAGRRESARSKILRQAPDSNRQRHERGKCRRIPRARRRHHRGNKPQKRWSDAERSGHGPRPSADEQRSASPGESRGLRIVFTLIRDVNSPSSGNVCSAPR